MIAAGIIMLSNEEETLIVDEHQIEKRFDGHCGLFQHRFKITNTKRTAYIVLTLDK